MGNKEENNFMDRLLQSFKQHVESGRIEEAIPFLADIASKTDQEKLETLKSLALAPDKTAFELLSFLAGQGNTGPEISGRVSQLIIDRAHINFNFILIILKHSDRDTVIRTIPLLKHILTKETDSDILSTIIRKAGKIKMERLVDDIAEFIFYDNTDLKIEAVKALEKIGTDEALEKLIHASKTSKCDQNILDAIEGIKLNNSHTSRQVTKTKDYASVLNEKKSSKELLLNIEQLTSDDIETRFKTLSFLSDLGPDISIHLLDFLKGRDLNAHHDLTVNILRIIARTLPPDSVNKIFDILEIRSLDSTIKFAAYSTLGAFPEIKSTASIVHGISDPALFVRLAAIKTLDKNVSDFVGSEVRNKIETGTRKAEMIAQSILDARAKNMIEYLMASDTFSYIASNHLLKSASIQVIESFIEILEKRNLKSTARKYTDLKNSKEEEKRETIIVISSSEAILNTYSRLIYSCGFKSVCFKNSQDAFETMVSKKPDAVICDLLLNNMTGIEFAKETREIYPASALPVMISTVQQDLGEGQLDKFKTQYGINTICRFPAKPAQIKTLLTK